MADRVYAAGEQVGVLTTEPLGRRQIGAADRLILTKTDACPPADLAALRATLGVLNPGAQVSAAVLGETVALPPLRNISCPAAAARGSAADTVAFNATGSRACLCPCQLAGARFRCLRWWYALHKLLLMARFWLSKAQQGPMLQCRKKSAWLATLQSPFATYEPPCNPFRLGLDSTYAKGPHVVLAGPFQPGDLHDQALPPDRRC